MDATTDAAYSAEKFNSNEWHSRSILRIGSRNTALGPVMDAPGRDRFRGLDNSPNSRTNSVQSEAIRRSMSSGLYSTGLSHPARFQGSPHLSVFSISSPTPMSQVYFYHHSLHNPAWAN